jgi:molecular chaperone HtpG
MTDNPRIGKDVIESLTLGMYEDCRFIYREYIQNSADQVDKAVAEGLINAGEDEIHITISPEERCIIIEDNATGISSDKVIPILRNIAHSTKKRGEDKGFRGIGRLGGLGYCSKLIFETTYAGEEVKSIMTWDADLLKQIINDRNNSEEAVDVLARVTGTITKEASDKHYFKVILENVTSDELLNVERVKNYLSMVAPVDISSQFYYRYQINEFARENGLKVDIYNIYINGEQIYKPYTPGIYEDNQGGKKKVDDILGVDFLLSKDDNGNIIYWGWYSLSRLKGQMKQKNIARGIRLRKENIQIGDEEICKKFFANTSDQRFSFYYFGEIHAISKDLIPNSRRDYFGENAALASFEKSVKQNFLKLRELCYDASDINKNLKIIAKKEEIEEKIKQKDSYFSTKEKEDLQQQLEDYKRKSDEALKQLERKKQKIEETDSSLKKIIDNLTPKAEQKDDSFKSVPPKPEGQETTEKTKFRTDSPTYSRFSKAERKLIGRIYASIANAIPDERQRDALIKVIEEDLTR